MLRGLDCALLGRETQHHHVLGLYVEYWDGSKH